MGNITGWHNRRGAGGSWVPERIPNSVIDTLVATSASIVTLDEAKIHLGIELSSTDYDTLLTSLLVECQAQHERYTGLSYSERTVQAIICNARGGSELPYGPFISMTTITDGGEFSTGFDDSFSTGTDLTDQAIIVGLGFKKLIAPCLNVINLQYQAGYDTPPPDLKQALKLEVAFRFRFRNPSTELRAGVNPGVCFEALTFLTAHRRKWFM